MPEKFKNNLTYLFCAGIGFLNFILLAIPYITYYHSYSNGSGKWTTESTGESGYRVMDLWGQGFGGIMSSVIQILVLVVGISLLAWGIMGLIKELGYFKAFPDSIGKIRSAVLGEIGLFIIAALNILLLIFLIVLSVSSRTYITSLYKSGIGLSAGVFVSIVITVGSVVALKLLQKNHRTSGDIVLTVYLCPKCGKKAKSGDKFCSSCGAVIVSQTYVKEENVCSKCGQKAEPGTRFCSVCGGEIVKKPSAAEQVAPAASASSDTTSKTDSGTGAETEADKRTQTQENSD